MTSSARRARLSALATLVALAALGTLSLAAAIVWRVTLAPSRGNPSKVPSQGAPATLRDPTGPLSMAAVGDSLVVRPWPNPDVDRPFDEVTAILRRASFAVTNLEENLRDASPDSVNGVNRANLVNGTDRAARGTLSPRAGWPVGPGTVATDLRRAGFTIVTRANNHAADEGAEGLQTTGDVLDRAGLHHAGAGADANRASAPIFLGTAPRRIAVIAVTTSASDEARATPTRGEIRGRPGVSTLRYAAEVTADPATYATLAAMPGADRAGSGSASAFHLAGRLIKKGSRTSVELVADSRDVSDILEAVASARAQADIVVVTIHSHEPGNLSQAPAPFVREFARQAIDRGASVVVGSGPRQLRGIEIYRGRVIFYSLGNFAFDAASIPRGAADAYDANTNLNELALESLGQIAASTLPAYDEAAWWESIIATVTFEQNAVTRIHLQPIDLGTGVPLRDRGRPRLAAGDRGSEILRRLADMSKAYGTAIRIENGVGVIEP